MKIYKGNYGYSILCKDKVGDHKYYINVGFKKGFEPFNEELEGDLIFKDIYGKERSCFFTCYNDMAGNVKPKLMMMEEQVPALPKEERIKDLEPVPAEVPSHYVEIKDEDLPFY